ncbi:hypothetical protein [Streptomyces sp. 6-11-2]|uniref:hypothetical protein n=1 Tax=Streptomyces sp. 6-11-2 TaxID=2585753 RepID=UPI001143B0C9|nr:hypothetical protein [Streptomyces sp. 6-11-2]GED88909.1 hypothetical protein TNCT6_59940 [Streptomyces sp. 6-11-2]
MAAPPGNTWLQNHGAGRSPRHHPDPAARLLRPAVTARNQGATERRLQQIAAEGLAQMYFRANNRRAHGLGVEVTDRECVEITLQSRAGTSNAVAGQGGAQRTGKPKE